MFELLKTAYNKLLFIPLLNALVFLYFILGENMGFAIIALTIIIRIIMFPLTKKQMQTAKTQRELQPQLAKLKKKYKNKQVYSQKQMALFKENGINPASGCITSLIPILIIFPLYRAFTYVLSASGTVVADINNLLYFDVYKFDPTAVINTQFGYLNLAEPAPYYILPLLAALSQFFMSKIMMPGVKKNQKLAKQTPEKSDDIMSNMQGQMTYMMPIITFIIGIKLPSGLVLYWFVSTLFALIQYALMNKEEMLLIKKETLPALVNKLKKYGP